MCVCVSDFLIKYWRKQLFLHRVYFCQDSLSLTFSFLSFFLKSPSSYDSGLKLCRTSICCCVVLKNAGFICTTKLLAYTFVRANTNLYFIFLKKVLPFCFVRFLFFILFCCFTYCAVIWFGKVELCKKFGKMGKLDIRSMHFLFPEINSWLSLFRLN